VADYEVQNPTPPVDPRIALAAAQLAEARAKLEASEYATRKSRPTLAIGKRGKIALSASSGALLHLAAATLAMTAALFIFMFWLQLMSGVIAGLIAFPVALVLVAGLLSYVSVCYLAVIESTAHGKVEIELEAKPQDWFWTLPTSFAMLAVSATTAWAITLLFTEHRLMVFVIGVWLLYPIFQLSIMETTTVINPVSLPVLRSLIGHPVAWISMYVISALLAVPFVAIFRYSFAQFSYEKLLLFGPAAAATLMIYAWLLGQLSCFIMTSDEAKALLHEEEVW
jgi:hypothetical protein